MSQVYSTEPQTAGRVIFETTHGPLEIQLWSRECPGTTKYFLQLCLDGYFENMLFHRIVPNFLVQTGALRYDPVARKASQKAEVTSLPYEDWKDYRERAQATHALERRQYELNNRIRFNHRGQVAMALPVDSEGMGEEDMAILQPQFFITLDQAADLDGKHVCFGTVTGPTVFNALRIGNTDIDELTGQPTVLEEAPRIERVKILDNPIHSDLVGSPGLLPWKISGVLGDKGAKKEKKKRRGIKNINVLSFGDEMEHDDLSAGHRGIRSSHDLVESKRLSKNVDRKVMEALSQNGNKRYQDAPSGPDTSKKTRLSGQNQIDAGSPEVSPVVGNRSNEDTALSGQPAISYKEPLERKKNATEKSEKQVEAPPPDKDEKPPKLSLVEARRAKYAKSGTKDKKTREEDTMAKFVAFQSKVGTKNVRSDYAGTSEGDVLVTRMVRRAETASDSEDEAPGTNSVAYHGQILDNEDDAQDDWMQTKFKCRKHQDLDAKLGGDGRDAMEDYKVIDEKYRGSRHSKNGNPLHHRSRKRSSA